MASDVKAGGGASPTLIASAMPLRVQRAVNWYGLSQLGYLAAKAIYDRYRAKSAHRVTVSGDDPLYPELEAWLITQIPAHRRKVTRIRYVRPPSTDETVAVADDGSRESLASHGNLAVVYDGDVEQPVTIDGHKVTVHVQRPEASDRERNWRPPPEMRFIAHTIEARDAVVDMLARLAAARASEVRKPAFYVTSRWNGFTRMRDYHPRRLDSIVLPDDIIKPLVDDLAVFLGAEARYSQLGIPWHRGYLLHGVPGTGKSSLAAALAAHFALDTYFLVPTAIESDDSLMQMLAEISPRSMLVIEDIDVMHAARDRNDDTSRGVSMQALLQALDGMVTPHGQVLVMTTNRVDVLDPALRRPGRADLTIEVPQLDGASIVELLYRLTGTHYDIPAEIVLPGSDIVEVVKPYIQDPGAMDRAIRTWLSEAR